MEKIWREKLMQVFLKSQPKKGQEKVAVVGLTGGIGSGKSRVSSLLKKFGAAILEADKLGHTVLEKESLGFGKIVATFGKGILDHEGKIDRKKLGALVFSDPKKLEKLNAISHPLIHAMAKEKIAQLKKAHPLPKLIVLDAALLLETGWDNLCEEIWVVHASKELVYKRLKQRDGYSQEEAEKRMKSQLSAQEKLAKATRVISNHSTLQALEKEVKKLWVSFFGGQNPPSFFKQ